MRPAASLIPLATLTLASAAAAQVPVVVVLPEPMATTAQDELGHALGPGAVVRTMAAAATASLRTTTVLVGVDEWQLWQLSSDGRLAPVESFAADLPAACRDAGGRWVLPWSLRYGLAVAGDRSSPRTWEELALETDLTDRLGLCPPSVDPSPWFAGMEECLVRGGTEAGGYALWTTLDARVGHYCADYPEMLAGLAAGRLAAAVLPAPLVRTTDVAGPRLRLGDLGPGTPVARLGVALLGPHTTTAAELARRIAAAPLRQRLADRLELAPAVATGAAFDGVRAAAWLQHFSTVVEGRGRGIEHLGDLLDIAFTVLFALIVVVVWRRQRRDSRVAP